MDKKKFKEIIKIASQPIIEDSRKAGKKKVIRISFYQFCA